MKKIVVSLSVAVAFMFLATISSANVTNLEVGKTSVCDNASRIAYNTHEA